MFERFTTEGRQVLVLAREEAATLHHKAIHPEHLLLALIGVAASDDEGVVAAMFADAATSLDEVRTLALADLGRREADAKEAGSKRKRRSESGAPFSHASKRVLEFSLREALQFGHNYISDFHVLLALAHVGERDGDEALRTLLARAGLELEQARNAVRRALPNSASSRKRIGIQRATARGRRIRPGTAGFEAVVRESQKRSEGPTTTGDLLLALLDVPGTHAETALANASLPDRAVLEAEVDRLRMAGDADGFVSPRVTVDKQTGAVMIHDPAIAKLLQRSLQGVPELRELTDRIGEAFGHDDPDAD